MKKYALITGATSGIGKSYAEALAQKGYNLILTGRRREVITDVATNLKRLYGVDVEVCLVDFAQPNQCQRFLNYIDSFPSIDFLVNNAGYGAEASFTQDTLSNQLAMLDVHNKISVCLCHIVSRKMKQQSSGAIINVSSLAGFLTLPKSAMYCATKAFLINFSKSFALEMQPYGIQVQCLCPGFVHTDFHQKLHIDRADCQTKGPITWMDANDVVHYSLYYLKKQYHTVCIPGKWNQVGYSLLRCIPQPIYDFGLLNFIPKKL